MGHRYSKRETLQYQNQSHRVCINFGGKKTVRNPKKVISVSEVLALFNCSAGG